MYIFIYINEHICMYILISPITINNSVSVVEHWLIPILSKYWMNGCLHRWMKKWVNT